MTPLWPKLKAVAPTHRYGMAILGDSMVPVERLSRIGVPTAVFGGEKSAQFLRDAVEGTARANPKIRKLWLPDQTHNLSAKKVAPLLREYLSE